MTENEIRIHNIALLYEILRALHPDEPFKPLEIAADYDGTVEKLKEILK